MTVWILIVGGLWLFNTAYWLFICLGVLQVPTRVRRPKNVPESTLIVVAKNPPSDFHHRWNAWLGQENGPSHVILVDDGSDEPWLNASFSHSERGVEQYRLEDTQPGKKQALAFALSKARTPYVVLTDADGMPSSDAWPGKALDYLNEMNGDVLLMFAPFFRRPGWLSRLIRFEGLVTALQYFSWWSIGRPYMSVGRNVVYSERAYRQFRYDAKEPASGDDDLFFQKMGKQIRTYATLDPDNFVYSEGPRTWTSWLDQKSRHLTTASRYPWSLQVLLGLFSVSQICMAILMLFLLIKPVYGFWTLMLLRIVLILIFIRKPLRMMELKDLHFYVPLLDVLMGMYLLVVAPLTLWRDPKKWSWND